MEILVLVVKVATEWGWDQRRRAAAKSLRFSRSGIGRGFRPSVEHSRGRLCHKKSGILFSCLTRIYLHIQLLTEATMKAHSIDKKIDAIAGECLSMRLRILNRVVTGIYEDAMRPLGVKASQLNILVAAWKMGTATPQKVCEVLHLDPSTLSRNVERMRAAGWLETVAADDGRAQPFRLTDAGRKLLEKAVPLWETAQEEAKRVLGNAAVAAMERTVKSLRGAGSRQ
jgi:DNA-binding MarR family transcriptional regulator